MRYRSLAVDLPGRRTRPSDVTRVTPHQAAQSVVADIEASVVGNLVLVGHSVAGVIIPSVAARLGPRAGHLVFIAGVVAAHGVRPLDLFMPGQSTAVRAELEDFRQVHRGKTLEMLPRGIAARIDAFNLTSEPISWDGVRPDVGRTYVRCLGDRSQSRSLQQTFVAGSGATRVVDIDAGHTPAVDAPAALAALLDRIIESLEIAR